MKFSSRGFAYDALLASNFRLSVGKLFQVSEISVIRGGEIGEHIQYCDEITYAISGSAKIYSGDSCDEIHSGQIHYIKAGPMHKIIADSDSNFNYICIGFSPDSTNSDIKSFTDMRKETDFFIKTDDDSIRNLAMMLLNEFYIHDSAGRAMIEAYLLQILISAARIYRGNLSYIDKQSVSTSNYAVYNALRYIDREYMHITGVQDVAKTLSYSACYLSHIFSEKVGMSVKEYIIKKKLTVAAEMLVMDKLSIEEISEYLNFNSAHTFRQAFKRIYSVNPSEYRKVNSKF